MSDEVDAQLEVARRREAALAGVLRAVCDAGDDPAWNAVRLAVAMRDRTAELSTEWKRRGHDLELGIGIAVGYATCGEIGFDGRTEYTAIGTVVNLSARVCSVAAGGQILVANNVFTAVEDRVESTPLGDTEFKGLSRPVPIHEVTALR
jgi:class 3 adenylate cyclase